MWSAAQRASASLVTLPVPHSDEGRLLKNAGRATPTTPSRACLFVQKRAVVWSSFRGGTGLGPELRGRRARETGLEEEQD